MYRQKILNKAFTVATSKIIQALRAQHQQQSAANESLFFHSH